jgi:AraC-like DNA-binding protein
MKLNYRQLDKSTANAFLARREFLPCLEDHWHFHDEYELIYFLKSNGVRYIGSNVDEFKRGELYLIGGNLPHLFKNKNCNDELSEGEVDIIIIQFRGDFLGKDFLKYPEATNFNQLLERSRRGLIFDQKLVKQAHPYLVNIAANKGLSGLSNLIKTLDILSSQEDHKIICQYAFLHKYRKKEITRMAYIINYMTDNYHKEIELSAISEIAHLTPNAFCRFFKNKTGKTYSEYLNEIRIGNACKLLIEGNRQISEVAFLTGFSSLSNFNRRFKNIIGKTPTEYLHQYNY